MLMLNLLDDVILKFNLLDTSMKLPFNTENPDCTRGPISYFTFVMSQAASSVVILLRQSLQYLMHRFSLSACRTFVFVSKRPSQLFTNTYIIPTVFFYTLTNSRNFFHKIITHALSSGALFTLHVFFPA